MESAWYLSQYPEVARLGLDPAEHYLKLGAALARDPGRGFSTGFYLQKHPEVAESGLNPLVHYVLYGQEKGLPVLPEEQDISLRLEGVRDRLLSLGFTEAPLAELTEMARDTALGGAERAQAARELALWHLRQKTAQDRRIALDWLGRARAMGPGLALRAELAVVELLCHFHLGRAEAGWQAYERAALAGEVTPDLMLARGNLQPSPEGRLVWINQVLTHHGLAPLSLVDDPALAAYDRLRGASDLPAVPDGPKVTVLVAAYEAGPMLATALASLQAQTWRNLEILVIDDCSPSPETRQVAARFAQTDPRIRLIEMPQNGGAYVARNRGLEAATGSFVTLNDADDWAHPRKIETQARYLMENPGVMGCTSQQARAAPELTFTKWAWGDRVCLLRDNISSFMMRHKEVFARVGYWDSARFGADDERIRRIRRAFGEGAVQRLNTGPLAFQRDIAGSAVADGPFGADGRYFGARLEYAQAQAYHHDLPGGHCYASRQRAPRFPIPAAMHPDRPAGPMRFDCVFGTDLRADADIDALLAELTRRGREGERLGLFQLSHYDHLPAPARPEIRAILAAGGATMLVYGEKALCDRLILIDPYCLIHPQRFVPQIESREGTIRPLPGQPALPSQVARQCEENARAMFPKPARWRFAAQQGAASG